MVNWFNETDTIYRTELREMHEMNFVRFVAKLEQRLTEFGAGQRLEIGAVSSAVGKLDARLEQRLAQSDAQWERRLTQLDAKVERQVGELKVELHAQGKALIQWMVGLGLAAVGLIVAILR